MKSHLCALRRVVALAVVATSVAFAVRPDAAPTQSGPDPCRSMPRHPAGCRRHFPGITEAQLFYYQQALNLDFQMVDLAVTNARTRADGAPRSPIPRDDAAIAAAVDQTGRRRAGRRDEEGRRVRQGPGWAEQVERHAEGGARSPTAAATRRATAWPAAMRA